MSHADVITFTGQSTGAKANGYTVGGVTFSDTSGSNLELSDYGVQSHGLALSVGGDDASFIKLVFADLISSLTLSFGNDDPGFTSQSDKALLTVFLNGVQVGQSNVNLNRNDIMDQTISFTGSNFNEATFGYTQSNKTPLNLIEIIDDVTFTRAAVPEPTSIALLGLGLLGVAASRRKAAKK